jgi:hypothetical protein
MDEEERDTNLDENPNNQTDSIENSDNEDKDNEDLEKPDDDQDEQEVTGSDSDSTNGEEESDTVPLKTYLKLKDKYKKSRDRLAEFEDNLLDEKAKDFRSAKYEKFVKAGYSEEEAKFFADDALETYVLARGEKKSKKDEAISEEIDDLSYDESYSDIKDYKNEIVLKLKQAKQLGMELSVEDAYFMVSKTSARKKHKENTIKEEIKESLQRKNNTQGQPVSASGKSSRTKLLAKLDDFDKKALRNLQKYQPERKWTVEKYIEVVKNQD